MTAADPGMGSSAGSGQATRAPARRTESVAVRYLPAVISVPLGPTTAFVVRDRSAILIDTGNPGDEMAILAAMRRACIRPDEVSLILVTHGHPDNYGSADALRELTGAPVAVHEADAGAMRLGFDGLRFPAGLIPRLMRFAGGRKTVPGSGGVEPDIVVRGIADLAAFGVRGRIVPTPGHTSGSISVLVAGGTAIVGDLLSALFPGGRPRLPFRMDDPAAARRSLRTLLAFGPERVYGAHGGPWRGTEVLRWFGNGR
ncbi:MBL fold metallo-hydrolase [Methanoculleus oceani]|uniref:MBL fold metallo-hydrolase n=1 Tax=Methanoculleus oceani TaxID=2184756 RepID=A0ABD4TBV4_9EURY|nr:MBL fold metallo-hydrolase [Methanoculleus sp. CWC-02]MCM2464822.1 MBL fold metallo-hydrolase [Methanoculleus sp. CWC-02]